MAEFPVFAVPEEADRTFEQLGTKPKFWYSDETLGRCLFKESRPQNGEDWAEKIVAELCDLLGLPHARYELAVYRGKRGVISPNFVKHGALVLGNELLLDLVDGYPTKEQLSKQKLHRVREHTLPTVLSVIGRSELRLPEDFVVEDDLLKAADVFVGYIMLDCWIGNQDRHHGNWAFVSHGKGVVHLAPTFDHASSLGRNESDDKRLARLETKDRGYSVQAYADRAESKFFKNAIDVRPMSTFDAFVYAANENKPAARAWLNRLETITAISLAEIFLRVPASHISRTAIEFASRMLEYNRQRLLALRTSL